jgi:hypothetical protein
MYSVHYTRSGLLPFFFAAQIIRYFRLKFYTAVAYISSYIHSCLQNFFETLKYGLRFL